MGNESNSMPIYMQIVQDFKFQITTGILKPKDKLPSVRELALTMTVNPNTIQKAYKELEDLGYITTVVGKGNYVSENLDNALVKTVDEEYEKIFSSIEKLKSFGISEKEILEEIKEKIKKGI